MKLEIIILGRPVPKKNNPVMVAGRNLILPSKAYREYAKDARNQLLWKWPNQHIPGCVAVTVRYFLPNKKWHPDLVGLLQATGDILQNSGLIGNDRDIRSWGQSEIAGIDKDNPRAEITIESVTTPDWWPIIKD